MTASSTLAAYLPGLPLPSPASDGLDTAYWDAARHHELVVQRCEACRAYQWGPEWICHACRSFDLVWAPVEPKGRVYSWERVWNPVHPALRDACPYLVVLVELPHADGVRMVGNLLGDPMDPVVIGEEVEAVFEDHDDEGVTLVQWRRIVPQ
jgi:uncharacterized OB-fold protein